jgi:hypothetical protein
LPQKLKSPKKHHQKTELKNSICLQMRLKKLLGHDPSSGERNLNNLIRLAGLLCSSAALGKMNDSSAQQHTS